MKHRFKIHIKNLLLLFIVVLIFYYFIHTYFDLESNIKLSILLYVGLINVYLLLGISFNNSFKKLEKIGSILFLFFILIFIIPLYYETLNFILTLIIILIPTITYILISKQKIEKID